MRIAGNGELAVQPGHTLADVVQAHPARALCRIESVTIVRNLQVQIVSGLCQVKRQASSGLMLDDVVQRFHDDVIELHFLLKRQACYFVQLDIQLQIRPALHGV